MSELRRVWQRVRADGAWMGVSDMRWRRRRALATETGLQPVRSLLLLA